MRAKRCCALVGLLGVLVLGSPRSSDAQWVLYDDFTAALINPEKWEESFASGGPGNPTTEVVNLVKGRKLVIGLTQYGLTSTSAGISGGQARLATVASPDTIIGMQAAVTVHQVTVDTCAGNSSTATRARAQIAGGFFNDGLGGGGRTGDIIAGIQKIRDTILGDVIQAFIVRCTDTTCSSTPAVAGQNFITTWTPDESHTMSVLWDRPNKQFIFSVVAGKNGTNEDIILSYAQGDSTLPTNNFKQLSVNNSAANCSGSRKRSGLEASYDEVMVQRNYP